MRLILFHQYFLGKNDPGGSRWNELTSYFSQRSDIHIDVMAGNIHYATGKQILPHTWLNREKVDKNITLYRTWTYAGYNSNFIGRLIGYFSYTFSSFWQAMKLHKPDVIIITSPSLFVGIAALILSYFKKSPFIFEVRDLWPESAVATGVLNNKLLLNILYWLEHKLYEKSAKIVVLTPAFKKNIEARFPKYSQKIEIVTNGADFSIMNTQTDRKALRKKLGWENKKVFAYFGAHGLANDLMQVVEAAKHMQDEQALLFVLIGDGMQKEMLKKKAAEYGLKNLQFIDSVPKTEVSHYIEATDICMAILKKTDTFKTVYPNKVFDYMSCKKPVLVTIDGITRELIETANCGLYSEPENLLDFENKIKTFLAMQEEDLSKLGNDGFTYVKAHFDREKLAEKYLYIIEDVVHAKNTL